MLTFVNQIFISFISDDDQVSLFCETRNGARFFARKDDASRILRSVVVDGPGAIGGVTGKGCSIPAARVSSVGTKTALPSQ